MIGEQNVLRGYKTVARRSQQFVFRREKVAQGIQLTGVERLTYY